MYNLDLLYYGGKVKIMAIVKVMPDGREKVLIEKFINALSDELQGRVVAFITKIGDNGFPRNREKMKKLGSYELFELKIYTNPQIRIFCIPDFRKNELILIDGEFKASRKIRKSRLDSIQNIWNDFLKGNREE